MDANQILIVDDVSINREILKVIFEDQYQVLEATDGEEAIEILKERQDIALMFLDIIMPRKTGLDVLAFMKEEQLIDKIPVIVITGDHTCESDLKAYEYGAADVIYKPFEARIVMRRTKNLLEQYTYRRSIENELELRTAQLRESQEKLARNNEFLIDALSSVVEFRSTESGEHVKRVKSFTKAILKQAKLLYPEYELTDEQIEVISQASALHDVGKIAVPDSILNKPGRLTPEEFDEMKKHTTSGCEILERFKQEDNEFYRYCYEICRWHHEKADGRGYPDRLVEAQIPIWSHATAVADCFDALVSKRVYKDAYAKEEAYHMILNGECGKFSEVMQNCLKGAREEMFELVEKEFLFEE